jgi:hypothetical protein
MTVNIKGLKHYTIEENGTVTNTLTKHVITPGANKHKKVISVTTYEEGGIVTYKLHRLLAEHFIPNPEHKTHVMHIDGNKYNNALSNLQWATKTEIDMHAYLLNADARSKRYTPEECASQLKQFFTGTTLQELAEIAKQRTDVVKHRLKTTAIRLKKLQTFKARIKATRLKNAETRIYPHKPVKLRMHDKITKEVIRVFNSYPEAHLYLGRANTGAIRHVVAGRRASTYGYSWSIDTTNSSVNNK